jgi:hypothetical protein
VKRDGEHYADGERDAHPAKVPEPLGPGRGGLGGARGGDGRRGRVRGRGGAPCGALAEPPAGRRAARRGGRPAASLRLFSHASPAALPHYVARRAGIPGLCSVLGRGTSLAIPLCHALTGFLIDFLIRLLGRHARRGSAARHTLER